MVETANHQQQHEHQHQQPPVSHPPPPLMPPLGAARGPAFPPAEQLAQLNYCIHSNPSWPQTVILAFQHYIVMLGSAVMIATILVPRMGGGPGDKARVIQSMLFMSGVNTLLQTLLGSRLPTVMGPSFAYLISVLGIINDFSDSNFTSEHQRFLHCIRAIQGALIVSSFINIILGYGRAWANLTRLFSPVVIVPVVCVVGLGLFGRGFPQLANCVEIGLPMLILLVLCQQYLRGLHPKAHSVLERFALLFCIAFVWVFAVILTVSGAYNNVGQQTKTSCRTDRSGLLSSAPWIRIPYPFQWGAPIFRASHVFGMMGAALVASAESTGTFYAAARLSGATAPPTHVLTRSIGLQGIGQLIEGIFGSAVGTTASVFGIIRGRKKIYWIQKSCIQLKTKGCDASILVDNGAKSERRAVGHQGVGGFDVIEGAKAQLEAECPGVVSCADIVAMAARDAVAMTNGPNYQVQTGRRDGTVSDFTLADNMPDVNDTVEQLKAKFLSKGLSDKDLVLLSAAHTIGTTACFFMEHRLYHFSPNGVGSDPSINPGLLPELQATCPLNGDINVRLPMDHGSGQIFDNKILQNIRTGFVVLKSDAVLYDDVVTTGVIDSYFGVLSPVLGPSFETDFVNSMIRMGSIDVKTGTEGTIRRVCSAFN